MMEKYDNQWNCCINICLQDLKGINQSLKAHWIIHVPNPTALFCRHNMCPPSQSTVPGMVVWLLSQMSEFKSIIIDNCKVFSSLMFCLTHTLLLFFWIFSSKCSIYLHFLSLLFCICYVQSITPEIWCSLLSLLLQQLSLSSNWQNSHLIGLHESKHMRWWVHRNTRTPEYLNKWDLD